VVPRPVPTAGRGPTLIASPSSRRRWRRRWPSDWWRPSEPNPEAVRRGGSSPDTRVDRRRPASRSPGRTPPTRPQSDARGDRHRLRGHDGGTSGLGNSEPRSVDRRARDARARSRHVRRRESLVRHRPLDLP
jgi:hypothetical protein